jgi:hypothetical protein
MTALVLLFASVATRFSTPKIQVVLICLSMLLLAAALIRMLTLPLRLRLRHLKRGGATRRHHHQGTG